ncbi:MAG: hypothetical protein JWP78_234 [Mucilaginibacter sp.]|nr:hypothetical protein [Mucilaginibacter sp.]
MWPYRNFLLTVVLFFCSKAYCQQQDLTFHLNNQLLKGKIILKVKWDINDPYLWVLAKNNEVYRVNTTTLAIDDYSSKFSAFSDQQFIDIAGKNQDSVWLASRSKLIQCFKGVAGLSPVTNRVNYPINSIEIPSFSYYANGLLIGTDSGGYVYLFNSNAFQLAGVNGPFKIFGSTYRRLIYSDYSQSGSFDITRQVPVVVSDIWGSYYRSFLQGGVFGNALATNTAFYSNSDLNGMQYNSNIFWGNSNGMFQIWNNPNASYGWISAYKQSLNGITVNKITDIYGLTSIGNIDINNKIINKENLLIGTNQGLYFSSSLFGKVGADELTDFSLSHYDDLGNLQVNDICVTGTAKSWVDIATGCENEVWLGTNDGLYLLIPDYSKYFNTSEKVWAAYFDLPVLPYPDTLFSTKICAGNSINLKVNNASINHNLIQWRKNGIDIPGAVSSTLAVKDSGDYNAVLYLQCENVHIETNHLKVQVISGPVFSFNYPDRLQYCDSTSTTLKTNNNNPGYQYRWYTNDTLNGVTTYNYTVTRSGKYKVEVSACMNSWVPSKEIEVDLISLPVPIVTADKTKYCAGDIAMLMVNTPRNPGYTINWYKDGTVISADQDKTSIPVTAGGNYTVTIRSIIASCTQTSAPQQVAFTPTPVYTFNYPDELRYCTGTPVTLKAEGSAAYQYRWYKDDVLTGDVTASLSVTQSAKYKVEVSACDGSWLPSKEVQVDLINVAPVMTTDKPAYCTGDNATLSISGPINPACTINWYRDNVLLPVYTNQTSLSTNIAGSYTVTIKSNQANTDGTFCSQTSAVQIIVFNPPPAVSIEKIVRTTLCQGQTMDLKAHYNTGSVKWSTGEKADQISVSTSGNYTLTVTSPAGCQTQTSIDVSFLPNPVLNINDAGVCVSSHKTAKLTAPAGLASYTWNGQAGTETYVADHPQTVILTVTDVNNCQATQEIHITDDCPDVKIPNTFTPNGDGINDTWVIAGLEYDKTALVSVFNRYGQQVYQSKGYGTPWNGGSAGKKLQTGTYYYIITIKNGTQKYSGSVTIIY